MENNIPWQRVSKSRPCPICGKLDWCLFDGPSDNPTAAICARTESEKRCGQAGWLHRLRNDDDLRQRPRSRSVSIEVASSAPDRRQRNWEQFTAKCSEEISRPAMERLARNLGVSIDVLLRLYAGWSTEHCAYTFPMTNVVGSILGVRLRGRTGRKWSVRGGREGLFIPSTEAKEPADQLLICEGPTDTAALLDLGFDVVGRPSCTGGVKLIVELLKDRHPEEVAIVADADTPGLRGANNLAAVLAAYVRSVRVLTPPNGIKDARDWRQEGATRQEVMTRIAATKPRRLRIEVVDRKRILQRGAEK